MAETAKVRRKAREVFVMYKGKAVGERKTVEEANKLRDAIAAKYAIDPNDLKVTNGRELDAYPAFKFVHTPVPISSIDLGRWVCVAWIDDKPQWGILAGISNMRGVEVLFPAYTDDKGRIKPRMQNVDRTQVLQLGQQLTCPETAPEC